MSVDGREKTSHKKNGKSDSSVSSNDNTTYRKKTNYSSGLYAPLDLSVSSDSDSETDIGLQDRDTPTINTFFKMAEKKDCVVIAEWAKFQTQLQDSMSSIVKTVSDLPQKIDDLVDSNRYLEASIDKNIQSSLELRTENFALRVNVGQIRVKRLDGVK